MSRLFSWLLQRKPKVSWVRQRAMWAYVFILPTFLYYAVMHVGSMFTSFTYSFQEYNTLSLTRPFIGLENYRHILDDPRFTQSLVNTFKFTAIRVPVVMVVSLGVALLLMNIRRAKSFYRMLFFIPFVTSTVAVAWVFKFMYLPNFGIFTQLFDLLKVPRIHILGDPRTALIAIVVVRIWQSVGYYALIFLAGLEGIPDVFYDAAKVDGASSWQRFRHVTVPLLNRTIVLVGVLVLISSLKTFTVVRTMSRDSTGGPMGTTRTLPMLIFIEAFSSLRMGRASAVAVVFFFIVLAASLVQRRLLTREFEY